MTPTEAPPAPINETPPTPPASLPDEGAGEDEEKEPLLFLLGHKELGVKVGGRKPDSSVLKIKGGKVDLEGQFDLEERFPVVFDLQVTGDINRHSIETESGTVKAARKTQEATICGTSTLSAYLAMKLDGHQELLSTALDLLGIDGK